MAATDGSTTCAVCGRVVLPEHVDALGRCVLCPESAEEVWNDLGRPADSPSTEVVPEAQEDASESI